MVKLIYFLCLFLGSLVATCLQAAAPTLTHLFPPGGQRGTTVTLTCHGKFDWPVSVHASGLDVSAFAESGKFNISIPEELPEDRIWIRLYNSEGASELVPFLISNTNELLEVEPNNGPQQAQLLEHLPIVINGELIGADTDSYSIEVESGQTLVAAVDAHTQLGSPIDSVLQISLTDGTVLADNHDSLGLDPRVEYTAKKSGKYLVRIFGFSSEPNQSIALQGCRECIYRLTLTTGPFVVAAVPLAVSSKMEPSPEFDASLGDHSEFPPVELIGPNFPDRVSAKIHSGDSANECRCCELLKPGVLQIPSDSEIGYVRCEHRTGSARVRVVPFSASLNLSRLESSQPYVLRPPHSVTGLLGLPNQIDRYHLNLKTGDNLVVTVEAQTLGMSTDPVVRLLNAAGTKLVEVDDSVNTKDVILSHVAAEDGQFTIEVMDRYRAGQPYNYYLLTARLEQTDFELTLKSDQIVVPANGSTELAVQVTRRSSVGPITVIATGLPDSVKAEPAVSSPEGDTAGSVILRFEGNGVAYSGPIRIQGSATEPITMQRNALTEPRLGVSQACVWLTALAKEPAD